MSSLKQFSDLTFPVLGMEEPALDPYSSNPERIVEVPVDQLILDPKNPRLAWRVDADTAVQRQLLQVLWTEMAVSEVAMSIAENGFFQSEPLFVIPKDEALPPDERTFVAVEGNRRLAAVRLLLDSSLREEVKATNLPEITPQRRAGIEKIPVIIYPTRESLWKTIGFRHINGIKPWDSFSKAEYVSGVHESYGASLEEIARRIGDTHTTVKRLYRGYKLLEQAEEEGVFDRDKTYKSSLYFSHLYTAADQKGYQEFLGIESEDLEKPGPVPGTHISELGELMSWLYGNSEEGTRPVIRTQNPDIKRLREALEKPEALSVLRNTRSLDEAYDAALGERKLFGDALVEAKFALKEAKGNVTGGYDGSVELLETASSVYKLAVSLLNEMEDKQQEVKRKNREAKREGR